MLSGGGNWRECISIVFVSVLISLLRVRACMCAEIKHL